MSTHTHRGWRVHYDPKPIPIRNGDWEATHPDYDGPGDRRIAHAATFAKLIEEIDCLIDEED